MSNKNKALKAKGDERFIIKIFWNFLFVFLIVCYITFQVYQSSNVQTAIFFFSYTVLFSSVIFYLFHVKNWKICSEICWLLVWVISWFLSIHWSWMMLLSLWRFWWHHNWDIDSFYLSRCEKRTANIISGISRCNIQTQYVY